jgi:hypothetical protein
MNQVGTASGTRFTPKNRPFSRLQKSERTDE